MKTMTKFWNVKTDGNKSQIDLFGYVGGSKEWNDGFNEEDFLKELREIPAENALEISINSFGGSVFTALSIYTLLKAHKGQITFRIDGVAMSAATIITSVPGAKVVMPKGSMMMIHKVSSIAMGNVDDFRKAADDMEKLENNILDIYAEKTGKTVDKIKPLVDAETYFTAAEAVEFGLADEVDENKTVENRMVGNVVNVNGLEVSAEFFKHIPDGFINKAEAHNAPAIQHQAKKEDKPMTLEKLKAEHPELVEAIRAEAVEQGKAEERTRIQAIEELGITGHDDLVNSAKYEKNMTAEQVAMAYVQAEKAKNAGRLAARNADAQDLADIAGNAGNEGLSPKSEQNATNEAKLAEIIEAGKRGFNNK